MGLRRRGPCETERSGSLDGDQETSEEEGIAYLKSAVRRYHNFVATIGIAGEFQGHH